MGSVIVELYAAVKRAQGPGIEADPGFRGSGQAQAPDPGDQAYPT